MKKTRVEVELYDLIRINDTIRKMRSKIRELETTREEMQTEILSALAGDSPRVIRVEERGNGEVSYDIRGVEELRAEIEDYYKPMLDARDKYATELMAELSELRGRNLWQRIINKR